MSYWGNFKKKKKQHSPRQRRHVHITQPPQKSKSKNNRKQERGKSVYADVYTESAIIWQLESAGK